MSDIDGKGGATNDHAIRDQELILPWLGVYETGNSGFRFVRIDLLDTDAILELKEVRAILSCAIFRIAVLSNVMMRNLTQYGGRELIPFT